MFVIPGRNLTLLGISTVLLHKETAESEVILPLSIDPYMIFENKKVYRSFVKFNRKVSAIDPIYIRILILIEKYITKPSYEVAEEIIEKYIIGNIIDVPGSVHKSILKDSLPNIKNGNLNIHEFDDLKRSLFQSVINPVFEEFKKTKEYHSLSLV